MAKAKQRRDPDDTRRRILAAATAEFARHGLGGARVDRIAAAARANKRMMYHYFGNKEALFARVLEVAYGRFRAAEEALDLDAMDPARALDELVTFTWRYYLDHPEFITLVNSENLHKARHIRKSKPMAEMNRAFIARMSRLLARGAAAGVFRPGVDPVQLQITIAAVGYHYLTNRFTGAIVYDRALTTKAALDARLTFNRDSIQRIAAA